MKCDGKNVLRKRINVCCDSRQDNCPYAYHIEHKYLTIRLCLRPKNSSTEVNSEWHKIEKEEN